MPESALLATGRLRIHYTSDTTHVVDFLCNVRLTGSDWFVIDKFNSDIDPATAAGQPVAVFVPLFATTTTFDTWELDELVGGAYVQRATGSLGSAGSSANATVKGAQFTYTFRNGLNQAMSLRLLGSDTATPLKLGYASLPTAHKNLVDEFLNQSAGHVGSWRRSKSAELVKRFLALVGGSNRKSRRRLGLV